MYQILLFYKATNFNSRPFYHPLSHSSKFNFSETLEETDETRH